jgi:hypothetical protein
MKFSDVIALFALFVSFMAFLYPAYLNYLSRPKLNLFLRIMNFRDGSTAKEEKMLQILMINDGYRPIIISQCEYISSPNNGKGNIGIYDELKSPYGIAEIVLPVLLEPAKACAINIFRAAVLNNGNMSIDDIYIIDNRDKKYHVSKSNLENVKLQAAEML